MRPHMTYALSAFRKNSNPTFAKDLEIGIIFMASFVNLNNLNFHSCMHLANEKEKQRKTVCTFETKSLLFSCSRTLKCPLLSNFRSGNNKYTNESKCKVLYGTFSF